MRNDFCSKCGSVDWYIKGTFSYCRPCHNEAQKRYAENKRRGSKPETLGPPKQTLEYMFGEGKKGAPRREKTHCRKGHPFSGDNVAVSSQRGGRHLRRRCRACDRNAKRVRYGLAPEPNPIKLSDLFDIDGG